MKECSGDIIVLKHYPRSPHFSRSNGKFFRQSEMSLWDLKHHSLPIGRFERLEQSAVVERFERAAVIGERLNRSLDLPLVQPLFANIVCVRFECQSN